MKKINVLYSILFACFAFLMWQGDDRHVLISPIEPFLEEVSESVTSYDVQSDSLQIFRTFRSRSVKRFRRTETSLTAKAVVIAGQRFILYHFFNYAAVWCCMTSVFERLSFYCVRLI